MEMRQVRLQDQFFQKQKFCVKRNISLSGSWEIVRDIRQKPVGHEHRFAAMMLTMACSCRSTGLDLNLQHVKFSQPEPQQYIQQYILLAKKNNVQHVKQ